MDTSQIYILIGIIVLLLIFFLLFIVKKNKKQKKLTPLAGLAFGFILAGIIFGGDRKVGYSLMGAGILIAVIDIIIKMRKK